jgi:hypothetical protein
MGAPHFDARGATATAAAAVNVYRTVDHLHPELDKILTDSAPFGPLASDGLFQDGPEPAQRLFDRSNLICAQTQQATPPPYIIGRKGAGKTTFLLGTTLGAGLPTETLRTSAVYSEMITVIRRYGEVRGPLFVDQVGEIWQALFDHVALFHACRTADRDDPPAELQRLWDYFGSPHGGQSATRAAELFLNTLTSRINDVAGTSGLREVIDGLPHGGVSFAAARQALRVVLSRRPQPLVIVMDNLEDLQSRLYEVSEVLAGLFKCVGTVTCSPSHPYRLQICLPSELFDQVWTISANPEKDFRDCYLTLHWTASELLKLAGTRLRLYLETHHPDRLERLTVRARRLDEPEPDTALLRAALPRLVKNGLGIDEDPVAYLLRHTQLLPRHLIAILNRVFIASSSPPDVGLVSAGDVVAGTRAAEQLIVQSIFTAFRGTFPEAKAALRGLSDRLEICFRASQLHVVFNRQGIRRRTNMEFDEFMTMLFAIGAVGILLDKTERYYKAHFQYTFDTPLSAAEDEDWLCFHPLFTRYLHVRSLHRLRRAGSLVTYPFGSDPADQDYRISLGYTPRRGKG